MDCKVVTKPMSTLKRQFASCACAPRARGIAMQFAIAGMQSFGHSPVDSGVLKTL
jgi:hypothetical protein